MLFVRLLQYLSAKPVRSGRGWSCLTHFTDWDAELRRSWAAGSPRPEGAVLSSVYPAPSCSFLLWKSLRSYRKSQVTVLWMNINKSYSHLTIDVAQMAEYLHGVWSLPGHKPGMTVCTQDLSIWKVKGRFGRKRFRVILGIVSLRLA